MQERESYLAVLEGAPWPGFLFDDEGDVCEKTRRCEVFAPDALGALVSSLLVRLRAGMRVEGEQVTIDDGVHAVDAWPVDDGLYVAVCRPDVSEASNPDAEAQRTTERARLLEMATRSAGIGFWDMNLKTGGLSWDEQLHVIHGLEPGSVRHLDDYPTHLIHPDDTASSSKSMMESLRTGGPYEVEIRHRWPDGTPRTHRAYGQIVLDAHGMPERALGLTLDVTEKRRVEAELMHAQKLDSIGELAGGVAHDFNNLLTVITSSLDMIEFELPDDQFDLNEFVSSAREAASHGAHLTKQLLTFARRTSIAPERVDLTAKVRGMHALAQRLVDEHVTLHFDPGDEPLWVEVDPTSFEQVLLNLVSNARDAIATRGAITVTLEREVESPALEGVSGVVMRVRDTGVGIPVEERDRIFEPFFTTKDVGEGTGLGLASCYGIVARAGGQIALESTSRDGTTFMVVFPEIEAPEPVGPSSSGARRDAPTHGEETLLVVEDDELVRRVFTRTLSTYGYNVLQACDGLDALDVFTQRGPEIDLVITDVMMPHMTGSEFIATIEQDGARVPVVFVSGYSAGALESQGFTRDDVHFVSKPFDMAEFAALLRDVLAVR